MTGGSGCTAGFDRSAGSRGLDRCQHVPDQGSDRGDAASGRGACFGFHASHVVPAADRNGRPGMRVGMERAVAGVRASGTPFVSFFTPTEMLALARDAGFREVRHVSAASLAERYFAGRTDGLRPPNNAEELLVATT